MKTQIFKLISISFLVTILFGCNTEQKNPPVNKTDDRNAKPIRSTNTNDPKLDTKDTTSNNKIEEYKPVEREMSVTSDDLSKRANENMDRNNSRKTYEKLKDKEYSNAPHIGNGLKGDIGGNEKKVIINVEESYEYIRQDNDEKYDSNSNYKNNEENAFLESILKPLSTFSIDVDTASYTNTRRWLNNGQLPTSGVVRTEEFINYFNYDYKSPAGDNEQPFSVYTEAASCPWNEKHQIIQIGLKGKEIKTEGRKPSNIVFLIDVSGSMNSADKLPLLKSGMKMLVNHLDKADKVAIVVYAGASGVALEPTSLKDKSKIIEAFERLQSGGSTNGAAGIHLAYELAEQNYIKEGNNRIILATDGDFNVGTTSIDQLQKLIEEKRKTGVFLSVLGFGAGNLNDNLMETLANKGNGNYNYIDRLSEAQKVLIEQLNSTLYTIAKDVKIQIEFNPEHISHYRLIGYENRVLAAEDFNNDKKDAGEIGAGHTVTALYEVVPAGVEFNFAGKVDDLKYQEVEKKKINIKTGSNEILTLKIRYKKPTEDISTKQEYKMLKSELGKSFQNAKNNLMWATATAAFAQKLNGSNYLNEMSWEEIEKIAVKSKGSDNEGYRGEMIQLIKLSSSLSRK